MNGLDLNKSQLFLVDTETKAVEAAQLIKANK